MYLTNRFYIVFVLVILFLGSGYAFAPLFVVGQWALVALIALVSADGFLLYRTNAIQAERHCADRFSNGDENEVAIRVENSYPRPVSLEIIDEIPFIFQQRNINFRIQLQANEGKTISYRLRPTQRGCLLFRADQGVCNRSDRIDFPALYLWGAVGYQGISFLSDVAPI